jgi:hypothetical protein
MEKGLVGPKLMQTDWRPCIEAYFDNEDLRVFGAATRHSMVVAGYPLQNLVNAEEVESYLREKGMVELSEHEMQLELTIPNPSPEVAKSGGKQDVDIGVQRPTTTTTKTTSQPQRPQPSSRSISSWSRQRRPQKRMVIVSLYQLIGQFTNLSICIGNGIEYLRQDLNSAIVASVIKIRD